MRIQLKQSKVVFYPEDHTYFLKDHELSGITSVLERQLFPDTYAGVDEEILRQAAEYGTAVHQSCEDFDSSWLNDGTQEVADYISICKEHQLVHEMSEYLISDNTNYASMIDKVFRVNDNTFDICDIKTYGAMTVEKLEKAKWQLSVYAYLFELQNPKAKVRNLFVIHLRNKPKKDGSFDHIADFILVNRIPADICKALLDADSKGEQFQNPYSIPQEIIDHEEEIRNLILLKKDCEEKLNAFKTRILNAMESLDVRTWQTDGMRITRKLPTTRSSFSVADFKRANPDVDLAPYMRLSTVAGSLSIAV